MSKIKKGRKQKNYATGGSTIINKQAKEAKNMIVYRRRKERDAWHWCRNCSNWPVSGYKKRPSKPTTGELCNECLAKTKKKNCRK